jgi:cell division protein FtsB
MIRNTNPLPLFRLALTMLTAALVLVAAGYARLRAENRQLAADAEWQRATVELLSQNQDAYAAKIAQLKAENAHLRAENKDMLEGLEMIRKSGKSREQMVREGGLVLPGQCERVR